MQNKALGRILGVDYGEARIGLALSDPGQIVASPLKTLLNKKSLEECAKTLAAEFSSHSLVKIVIGLPLLLNGKESPTSLKVRELVRILEQLTEIPIILWDERLTTAQVERTLKEAAMRRKERAKYIDVMAAGVILQSYLDSLHLLK